jgi:hypothetical protein
MPGSLRSVNDSRANRKEIHRGRTRLGAALLRRRTGCPDRTAHEAIAEAAALYPSYGLAFARASHFN